tara:strand:+ start:426 stop:650 length:225 start_codon:yes stop_codon:yes gene_type:complete
MIIIVYLLIIFILIFVCFIGIKAAGAGIEAKKFIKIKNKNKNITRELFNLNKLYKSKAISKSEYQKAKRKILKD